MGELNYQQQSLWSSIERKCLYLIQRKNTGASLLQIHAFMLKNALETNVNLFTKFITTCASIAFLNCKQNPLTGIRHARLMFDQSPQKDDTFLCNAMITAYVDLHQLAESLTLYRELRRHTCFLPNEFTFTALPKSCGLNLAIWEGKEIHCHIVRIGFLSNMYVSTALIDMYAKFGKMDSAVKVFDEMTERSQVSWTALIGGYVRSGDMVNAKKRFVQMPGKDSAAFNVMIDGYVKLGDIYSALKLFKNMSDRNVVSWTSMINGYCRNGDVESARSFFDAMPEKNRRSWNVMIGGYCQNKQPHEALKLFNRMQLITSLEPDEVTIISVLPAIADLGALELGSWIHQFILRKKLDKATNVCTALVDMYAKCGEITKARELFDKMPIKETISWNAMINGFAINGCGREALEVFSEMQLEKFKPNEITMIGVLSACNHAGLLDEGRRWFKAMDSLGLPQQIEHYGCMIDLLGRSGCLEEAEKLIENMPYEANGIILSCFLYACGCYKDVTRAEKVIKNAIKMEPWNDGNYVVLKNLYAVERRWRDEDWVKGLMRENGAHKEMGCSVIEVDGKIREFVAGDRVHPHWEDLHSASRQLQKHMKGKLTY